ncbi:androgen-dependent TFPI-regulating protein-like [Ostrinia nubilalis]|uniref:androgen-dependent TFPI-regulating protein-like n=1 Tax=Ostrinia nubilalis TaxID=29057 RepID=UPI003082235E
MLLALFHAAVVGIDAFSLWYDQMYLDFPLPANKYGEMPFKGRLMFLTIWGLIMQTVYFSITLLNDLFGSNEKSPRKTPFIRRIKDIAFAMAFTIAVYVSTSFWGIYYYDKELIFPDRLEKVFPVWLNHTMHTFVAAFILIELLVTKRSYPTRKVGLTCVTLVVIGYITWMHVLHARTGAWVYPIFEVLNLPMRVVFLSFSVVFTVTFYLLGEKLDKILSPAPSKQSHEPKKKKR